MAKYYFTYDENGLIAFYSINPNQVPDKFRIIELEVTENEFNKMKQNYRLWIRDNRLICEKTQNVLDREREEQKLSAKQRIQTMLQNPNANMRDVVNEILQILN